MSWPWLIGCLVLWLSIGALFWRSTPALAVRLREIARPVRAVMGLVLLILSAGVLFGGLLMIQQDIPHNSADRFQPPWLAVAAIGGIFVAAQCFAVSLMMSLAESAVTNPGRSPSKVESLEGRTNE